MTPELKQQILNVTGAKKITSHDSLQSLWSGYGEILQVSLDADAFNSIVVKSVRFPQPADHPRGWQSDFAHERKLHSYQVELNWYQHYSRECSPECYVPQFLWSEKTDDSLILLLEDLTPEYPACPEQIGLEQIKVVLQWLANFHAAFMNRTPEHLWPVGTYWHLATRPEELKAMKDSALQSAAKKIDAALNNARYQTFIHGDAKLANFCFSDDGTSVAAVDFQYVGAGCGMKDVAYFFSSCLTSEECETYETELLEFYFSHLTQALSGKLPREQISSLVEEWGSLYRLAWVDFHRFLAGWSPEHWKISPHLKRKTEQVLAELNRGGAE